MTTQLRPVAQPLVSYPSTEKLGAAGQAGVGPQALSGAATTVAKPRTSSCSPQTQVSWLSPLPRSRTIPGGRYLPIPILTQLATHTGGGKR